MATVLRSTAAILCIALCAYGINSAADGIGVGVRRAWPPTQPQSSSLATRRTPGKNRGQLTGSATKANAS